MNHKVAGVGVDVSQEGTLVVIACTCGVIEQGTSIGGVMAASGTMQRHIEEYNNEAKEKT